MLAITIHRKLWPRRGPTTTIRVPRARTCTTGTKRVPVTRGPRSRPDIRNQHRRLAGMIRTRTWTHLLQLLLLLVRRDVLVSLLIDRILSLLLQVRRCKMIELRMRVRRSYRAWALSWGYVGVLLSINDTILSPNTNSVRRPRREPERSTSDSRWIPKR